FASGQITSIASNSSLALVGSEAFVADAGHTGSNSALTGLATNAGTLDLELGATISTTGNLNSTNRIQVDVFGREGGSHLTVGGTLSNSGSIQLGPGDSSLSADSAIGAAALVNNGSIDLFGGTGGTDATLAVAGNLTNSASHAINVHASGVLTVGGTLTNNGTINDSGTMSLAGAIAGQGTIALGDDSSLELHGSVASGQTIALGASSDLVIDNPASFAGTITGFAAGDAIDFAGRQVADYSFASSLLTVHFQDGSSSSIHLSGDFDSLVKESDGHGGTEIVVPEPDATFDGFYSALSALGNAASDGSIGGTIYGLATQAEASAVENALGMLGQAALGSDAAALWESVHSDSIAAARTLAGDGKASALTDSLSLYNTLIAGAVGAIGGGLSQSVETNVLAAATTLGNHISAGASSTQLRTDLTGLLATMAGSHAGSAAWQAAFNAAAPLADAVAGDAAGSAKLQGDVAALYDKIASGALDALGGSALQNAYAHGGQTIVGLGSDIAQGASAEQLVEDVDTIFGSVAAGASAGESVDETVGVFQNIVAGAQRLGSTVLAGGTNEQLRLDSQTLMALVESNEVAKRTGDDGQGYSSAANFAGAMMHYISAGASKADLLALSKAALVPVLGQFNDTQWGQLEAGVTQAAKALLPQFSAGGATAQHAEATFLQTILADYITVIGNSSTAKQGAITQLAHSLGIDVGTHDTASLLTDLGDFGSTLFSGLPAGIGLSSEASPGASGSGIQIGPVSITGQQIIDYAMGLGSAGAAQGFLEATAGVFGVTEGVAGLLAELGLGAAAAAEAAPILVGAGVALALDWALVSLLNQLNHTHNTPLGQQAWNALNNWAKNPTLPHIPLPTWGDVHMTTLDGTAYNFQAVGEFVLSESTKAGNSFEVQARMQPWAQGTGVSVMTEIAAKVGSDRVTFDIGRANTVWVDGKAAKLDLNHPVVELDGGAVAEVAPNSYLVTWKTGETIAVTDSGTYLNVTTLLGTGDGPNSVKGLLGPADGAAHAFELADGTVLNQPLTAAELYGEFANSWRVTNKTSLFDYGKGQTTATFTDKDFPAHPITLADLPADVVANAAAVVAAAGITDPVIAQQAELDFLATGDASFIATASQVQAQSAVPTTTLVDPSAAGAPAMAGIGAHDAKLTQATAGTTAVTFEVYLTQAATSDTTIHYAVVGGAGHLGASAFGGTLPSGDAVIRQGQTTAEVTITLPADALGSDASDLLQLAITPPTGIDAFAKTAQTEIVNGTPTRGTDAVPAFVLSGSTGTLTHKGNAWTLDLGKVGGGKTASTTLNFVNTATAGDTMGTPTFRLPAGAAFLNTVLGSQLSIDLSTATAGTFKEVVKVDATESNDSGFSGSLPRQTLTVIAEVTPAPGTPGRDTIVGTAGPDKISGLGGADTLSGAGGNDILNGGTGNDTLNGGSGRDTLNGGPGADKMAGGRGNDTYVVDNAHDKVIEAKNGGTDLVKSAISYKLGANIENLTLTGHKAINGTGNAVANHITGNTAANHLSGGGGNDVLSGANGADVLDGGVGKDILVGGKGNDLFLFDSKVTAANADHIRDFGLGHDRIELQNAAFTALTHVGKLAADDFVANTAGKATTTDQHIIYDTKTGGLFYDADGSGTARAGVLFATLDNHAHVTLTAADFLVV
ncbi:MAG TPA: VWD domain-containing protein, partial [Hyphomicrobiales bacterium]|nr:VWD domain-containing protein [Hyphomicrobiales bacterium]